MKKRLLAAVLCVTMLLGMLPVGAMAEPATHTNHCLCGDGQDANCTHDNNLQWQEWTSTTSLPGTNNPGNWYLTQPVVVSATTAVANGVTVNLCLNGQTVTMQQSGQRIYQVAGGAKLNVTDCTAVTTQNSYTAGTLTAASGVTGPANAAVIWLTGSGSQFNLYEGKITGFTASGSSVFGGVIQINAGNAFNMYGGSITGNYGGTATTGLAYGGAVQVVGTFDMYGGEISNNHAVATGNAYGGGVFVDTNATFRLHGGTIKANHAKIGAGVYTRSTNQFVMSGGYIEENIANSGAGGAVRVEAGSMELRGGYIRNNQASSDAGGVYTANGIAFTMTGGYITGNRAAGNGGGVTVQGAFTMSGGEISGNNANGTGALAAGGVMAGKTITLSGNAKIFNNTNNSTTPFNLRVGSTNIDIAAAGMGADAKVYITYTYGAADKVVGNANNTDYSAAFHSDDAGYLVTYNATTKKLQLTARPALSGISAEDTMVIMGTPKQVTATITPETADPGTITWTSADPAIVKVEQDANDPLKATVTGLLKGNTEITVSSSKGKSHTFTVTVLEEHKHCLCGDGQDTNCTHDSNMVWQPWTSTTSLPGTDNPGNWYLTQPVEVSAATAVANGVTVNLCLNGKTVTMKQSGQRIYQVAGGAKLTITDCSAVRAQDSYTAGALTAAENVTGPANAAAIWLTGSGSQFNLYEGKITGFTASGSSIFGGVIQINAGNVFNMYGGSITGNYGGTATTGLAYGGAVHVVGAFNMHGGEISANHVVATGNAYGGGVFVDTNGTFRLHGGTIKENHAKIGAGVYTRSTNQFIMSGGYIDGNVASNGAGGGVRVEAGGMEMTGGYIQNNRATSNGGGVYTASNVDFTMSGGYITGNEAASNGGGAIIQGAFTMSGGEISGNNVTAEGAGGVFCGGQITLSGNGKIQNNTLKGTTPFNLRVGSNAVTIGSAGMGADAKIGVTYTFNEAVKVIANPNDTDYSAAFVSDDSRYVLRYNADKKLVLNVAVTGFVVEDVSLLENQSQSITAVVAPEGADYGTITWTSSDPATVKVEQDAGDPLKATVTALQTGSVTLTVSGSSGVSASCTVTVDKLHKHCLCGDGANENCEHDAIQWQPWTSTTSLPGKNNPGNWYLTGNVELTAAVPVAEGAQVNLCLNGYSVTVKESGKNLYHVSGGAKLAITDCQDGGKLTAAEGVSGVFGGSAVYVTGENTKFDLYAGKITGFKSVGESTFGGAIQIANGSTFNLYGGEISGNSAGTDADKLAYGGAVLVNGTFNMYGGKISGNKVAAKGNAYGGGVFLDKGSFTMYGGEISGNSAKAGGGVYIKAGAFTLSGGSISNNATTEGAGAGVRVDGGAAVMNGGSIQGNKAATFGGGLYTANGIGFTMTGGMISGNEAKENGGGLMVSDKLTVKGGEISGNNVTTVGPGGVFCGGEIVLSGNVKIYNNTLNATTPFNLRVGSKAITIGSEGLAKDAKIGVTYTFNQAVKVIANANKTDYSGAFFSDNTKYVLKYNTDKKLVLEANEQQPSQPETPTDHVHCLCGNGANESCKHEAVNWQPWTSTTSLPGKNNPGNWYLTGNVELTAAVPVAAGAQVNLCLNGYSVTVKESGKNLYHVSGGAKLAITDCRDGGKLTAAEGVSGVFGGSAVYVTGENTQFDLYAGKITGFKSVGESTFGGAIQIANGSTFNLYGGEISGNSAGTDADKLAYGGAVLVNGTFNMYGGKISGNKVAARGNAYGGGVFLDKGSFTMYGGEISANSAKNGAGVYVKNGAFVLNGGVISENAATEGGGGGVRLEDGSFTMHGGSITKNTTATTGGGIFTAAKKDFTMTGGSITANTAASTGGGVTVQGVFTMSGGEISGNLVKAQNNPGVFAGGRIILSGDIKITGNTCADGVVCNLRVASSPLEIGEGGLSKNAQVGITYVGSDSGLIFSNANSGDYSKQFVSDSSTYSVRYDPASNKLMLYVPMAQTVPHADTKDYHEAGSSWNAWDVAGALPTQSGYYYLAGTVNLEKPAVVDTDAKIVLCLNGQTVDATTAKRAYRLSKGAELTICDCTAHTNKNGTYTAGKITGATNTAIFIGSEAPAVTLNLRDGMLTGNTIETAGAAVIIQGGATFNMLGGEISGNIAKTNGAGVFNGEGTFNLSGGAIRGNSAGSAGGGVYVTSKGILNMSGGSVSANSSKGWGGGLYLAGKSTISGGAVSGNTAAKEGAGVYVTDCVVTMTGGSVSYNSTAFNGGGFCVRGEKGKLELKGGQIGYNKAVSEATGAGNGAGLIVQGKGTLSMSGGTIIGNEAKNGGGGIRTAGGSQFYLYGGAIAQNKAYQGAGIYLDDDALIEGGSIEKNVAKFEGAGLYANNCQVTMNGGKVTDNELQEGNGAGICLRNKAQMTLNGGTVSGNKASYHGGGILVQSNAKLVMTGGTVSGNKAAQTGGGIRSSGCEIEITGGIITENEVGVSGAGIYGEVKLKLSDCQITKNKITGKEGTGSAIMLLDGAVLEMANVALADNETAGGTGALHLPKGATAQIEACKFTGNKASTGAAMYIANGGNAKVNGSTFTGNTATEQGSAIFADGILSLTDSTVTGNTDEKGNAAVRLGGVGLDNLLGGNVVIAQNQGGELLIEDGALVQIPETGLGDKAQILLYLPAGNVTGCISGPFNYERDGDIYTLTKGDKSLTVPDVQEPEQPETKPSVDVDTVPGQEEKSSVGSIVLIISAVILVAAVLIIIFLAKRKRNKE